MFPKNWILSGSRSRSRSRRVAPGVAIALFAILAAGGAAAVAQTTPADPAQNCAVSTARIGSVDVTEFFGIRGGPSSFADNFSTVPRCIRLEVDNPAPSDLLPVGGYVMTGFAFDPVSSSSAGPGITVVQVFLDDPNQGGSIVGEARPDKGLGIASPRGAAFGDQFATSGFRLTVQIPSSAAGNQHALFVLAQSGSGRVGTIAVPVIVGNLTPAVPTRTP